MKELTNKSIYKNIKKKRITGTVISFLLVTAIASFAFYFTVRFFVSYMLESKFKQEYEIAEYLERVYEKSDKSGKDDIYTVMKEVGRDFTVLDKNGKVIYKYGKEADLSNPKKLELGSDEKEIIVYENAEKGIVYIDKDGDLRMNLKKIMKRLYDEEALDDYSDEEYMEKMNSEGIEFETMDVALKDDTIMIPLWISVPVNKDNETLIVRAFLKINENDLVLFVVILAALAIVMLTLIIMIFVRTVLNIRRQRRVTNYFFTDVVTKGKNWMWFTIRGEQMLMKRGNAKNRFGLVSLAFINYRNYCLCHSVQDGEEMLRKVHDLIVKDIKKNEMLVHNSSANFAMILLCDSEEELKMRLYEIIRKLERIDAGHRFAFQAGVSVIDVEKNDNNKIIKRKNIDIENEYNNACSARETLSSSDDSGVAFFDDKLVKEEKWRDSVKELQEKALKNEEFQVYYQPKYDPRTDELRGAEALIRWQSPELGFVSPGRFIPIFEKNGFITNIDHYMIKHVAIDQKRWLDEGYKCVPVSVNVSRAHFVEDDLAEQIRDMVDEAGAPHKYIEIELTESAFFDDKNAMVATINKLKSYGFAVSMDDFGSGYSSLNSLKDMPLDVLKLDAEFFRGDSQDGRGEIVVSEAIKLAKNLKMRTVAEGVEVREQVDFLAGEGCDMIQGYYYAKPMPAEDYKDRMKMHVYTPEVSDVVEAASAAVSSHIAEVTSEAGNENTDNWRNVFPG
ncbi:MAG: EAL domain-containing protein [Eubacterium sp.]|nr:EAL domain-containing protein [Eubacterium sp.]